VRYKPTQATKAQWKMLLLMPVLVPMAVVASFMRRGAHRLAHVGVRLCDWAQR
jgi:hypothetical protein